jgi:hypothetical protein
VGRKWGVIAHSGVGKSALLEELRRDPRLAGKCIVELDSALPAWFDGVKADSFDKATSGDYWLWAKMSATQSALKQKADIIAGLYREGQLRRRHEARGFSLVVLSLPAEVHGSGSRSGCGRRATSRRMSSGASGPRRRSRVWAMS